MFLTRSFFNGNNSEILLGGGAVEDTLARVGTWGGGGGGAGGKPAVTKRPWRKSAQRSSRMRAGAQASAAAQMARLLRPSSAPA